ncbi:MAG TPA: hypothetical protein VJP78_05980, partial [Thermoleophilia bacterium]|nr:hypothetical protein [Thermoleophilia bacterium]
MQEKPWGQKTPDEKLEHRLNAWLNPPISFASPEAERSYKARVARLRDAILLEKTPDRVPVPLGTCVGYASTWGGLTPYDAMYDLERMARVSIDFNLEFQPDAMVPPGGVAPLPGRVMDMLDHRVFCWPGHGVPKDVGLQYIEKEWMRAEEYDDFIADPTDFLMRRFLPRTCGALEGLGRLSSVLDGSGYFVSWARPEVTDSLERLIAAGKEMAGWLGRLFPTIGRLQSLGFPLSVGGFCQGPFDFLGNSLRGTKGLALDLFRCPDRVIEACHRLVPILIRAVTDNAGPEMPPCVMWPLHRGADGFMNVEQFKTLYWPGLRAVALGLIDEGL